MPTYEFLCERCNKPFELTCPLAEYEQAMKKKLRCPKCKSAKVVRQISAVEVKTSKKS